MMKTIALGISPLLLAGCASLGSTGDKEAADTFWENAWSYYEGRDYPRSMNQIERGLAEDPEHYLLNLLQGMVWNQSAHAGRPELFQNAREQFEKVRSLRRDSLHDYRLWLGLGEANQGLYKLYRRRARQFERQAKEPGLAPAKKAELVAQKEENETLFDVHLADAERHYRRLTESDEIGAFPAWERLFILEMDKALVAESETERRVQLLEAVKAAEKYLEQNTYRQKHYEVMLGLTGNLAQENRARRHIREFRNREKDFRATFANLLYDLEEYDKALAQLDKVLDLDPTSSADYYNRARCHLKLENRPDARRDLEHFLRLTKQSFDAAQVKEATTLLNELVKK